MAHSHEAGLDQAFQGHLDFLPVWVTLQSLGQENLIQKIQLCFQIVSIAYFIDIIKKLCIIFMSIKKVLNDL